MEIQISKQEISKHVGVGKALHADWMAKVELVVKGVYRTKDLKPVPYTQSEFGKLFQSFAGDFHTLPTFKAIVTPLEGLHNMYVEVFQILNEPKPMFTGKEKWEKKQIEKACDIYSDMKEVSESLYERIDMFINEYSEGSSMY